MVLLRSIHGYKLPAFAGPTCVCRCGYSNLLCLGSPPRVKIEAFSLNAGMMELVDMRDLGSRASGVGVRVPMPAPLKSCILACKTRLKCSFLISCSIISSAARNVLSYNEKPGQTIFVLSGLVFLYGVLDFGNGSLLCGLLGFSIAFHRAIGLPIIQTFHGFVVGVLADLGKTF